MTNNIEKTLNSFRLLWGEAPPDSLKGKKGEEIEAFITEALQQREKEVVLRIREKKLPPYNQHIGNDTEKAYDLGKTNGYNAALSEIVAMLETK